METGLYNVAAAADDDADDDDATAVGGDRRVSTCYAKKWKYITTVTGTGASAMLGTTSRTRRRALCLGQPAVHEPSSTSPVSICPCVVFCLYGTLIMS